MKIAQNIFLEKKILIYGLGKSGISSFKFLKDLAQIYLFDDNLKISSNCSSLKKYSSPVTWISDISPVPQITKFASTCASESSL